MCTGHFSNVLCGTIITGTDVSELEFAKQVLNTLDN